MTAGFLRCRSGRQPSSAAHQRVRRLPQLITRSELHRRLKEYERYRSRVDAGAVLALFSMCGTIWAYRTYMVPDPSQANIFISAGIAIAFLLGIAVCCTAILKRKLRDLQMACPDCGAVFYAPEVTDIALTGKCKNCAEQILSDA